MINFSQDELIEIDQMRNLNKNSFVGGIEIIGYETLWNIATKRVDVASIPKEELVRSYAQVKATNSYFLSDVVVGPSHLGEITRKFRRIVYHELK